MTDDYERSELENNDLYDDYLSIVNSKNELQAQLDNLISRSLIFLVLQLNLQI